MYILKFFAVSTAILVSSVSLGLGQTDEDTANQLLIDAVTGSNGPDDPLYKRRLLSGLVEEYPDTAAARSITSGVVSLPDLPETPDWQKLLVADSVITGHGHGDFPALGRKLTHPGVDIGLPGQADCGLPVTAPLTGTVVRVVALDVPDEELAQIGVDRAQNLRDLGAIDGSETKSGIGNSVILRHGATETATFSIYLHLQETPASSQNVPWRVGMTVPAGEQIGKVGTTGNSYGCHLHFEARNFEGKFKYLHPRYENIYPSGDISNTDVFRNDWIAPDVFLRRAFIDRHLAANKASTPTASAIPEPELPGTHAESTAQIQHTSVPVAEATGSQAPAGDWAETSEARRTIRPGETAGDIVVAADGSASYRAAKLFPAARFPSGSELRLYLSPQGRHGLVYQWDLDYGGQRVALIDLTTRRIVRNDIIPEGAVFTQAAPQDVRIAMSSVAWSPDGRRVAFALSPGEWKADPVLVDTLTGASTTLFTDDLQPGHWTFPRLETLRSDGEDWIELTYEVLACADTDCEAPEVVGSISGGHRISALLANAAPPQKTAQSKQWTAAIVVNQEEIMFSCLSDADTVCLQREGASAEAIDFINTRSVEGGEGPVVPVDFQELGKVDIAHLSFFNAAGTTLPYFVNTSPQSISAPIFPESNLQTLGTRGDRIAQSILRQFPGAAAYHDFVGGMRKLPSGQQRFSMIVPWTEMCRACPIAGIHVATVEFDQSGTFKAFQIKGVLDARPVGGKIWFDARDAQIYPSVLQYLLNIRGYDAGAMDGAIGPQTRKALAEFQRENGVNSGTGYPDRATYLALAESTTMFKNGVNKSEKPNTDSPGADNSQLSAETSPVSTPPSEAGLTAIRPNHSTLVGTFERGPYPGVCSDDGSNRIWEQYIVVIDADRFEYAPSESGHLSCLLDEPIQHGTSRHSSASTCYGEGTTWRADVSLKLNGEGALSWSLDGSEQEEWYRRCPEVSPDTIVEFPDVRAAIDDLDHAGAAEKAITVELIQTVITLLGGMQPDGTAALLGISAKDFAAEFVLDPEAMLAVVGSDIVVSAGEAAFAEAAGDFVAGYMFASGPLSQLPNEWQVPLRAFVDATIVESVGLLATGTDPTGASLVGPIVDRLHDVYEIYQATNALSRTQASGLFAVANGAEITAELVRKHPSEKSEALKTDWFAMTRENLRDIVGADDSSASYNVTVLGYRALDALGRGDAESARAEVTRMHVVGNAAQGVTRLSAEGPIDLLVRLASGGKDSPKVLVETFLKSTALRTLYPATDSTATAKIAVTPEGRKGNASVTELLQYMAKPARTYGGYNMDVSLLEKIRSCARQTRPHLRIECLNKKQF